MNPTSYDSAADTRAHIYRVQQLMDAAMNNLEARWQCHDASKLEEPEKSAYDKLHVRLKDVTYGSEQYRAAIGALGPALDHHYAANMHHPEHWTNGIDGMSLLDLLEMLCDWKAAGERHSDGDMSKSLKINQVRFKISQQLQSILKNTAAELGWITKP